MAAKLDNAFMRQNFSDNTKIFAANVSEINLPEISISPRLKPFIERPVISAKHYLLADEASGKYLMSGDSNERAPIASTTKIMTAVIALEKYQLDDAVEISPQAAFQIGSDAYLRVGERITVEQLLYCMLLKSGNDSAYAMAQHYSPDTGSIEPFVKLMNTKAKELGMINTEYHDPAGLDTSGYSSAEDLFIITKYALNISKFREITSTPKYTAHSIDGLYSHELQNSNRLVGEYNYLGAIGVKTGYTPESGHCLVSAVERDGHTLIGVILNTFSDSASASADESRKLQDWAWQNVEWK